MGDYLDEVDNLWCQTFTFEDGTQVQIEEDWMSDENIGCVLWPSAMLMCRFFEAPTLFKPDYFHGKRVIELGAGAFHILKRCCVLSD